MLDPHGGRHPTGPHLREGGSGAGARDGWSRPVIGESKSGFGLRCEERVAQR